MYWDVPKAEELDALRAETLANPLIAWRREAPTHSTEPKLRDAVRAAVFSAVGLILDAVQADKRFQMYSYTEDSWPAVLSSAIGGAAPAQLELIKLVRAWSREQEHREHAVTTFELFGFQPCANAPP